MRSDFAPRSGFLGCGVAGAVVVILAVSAVGEDRCVLVEEYTATWCGPCVFSGLALSQLQDEHPDDLALLQIHISDAYSIPWGSSRFNSYPNHGSLPNVWFDGLIQHVGADEDVYDVYADTFADRDAIPADVRLDFGAAQISGATFLYRARVRLAAGAAPRSARLYMARALDHYPAGAHHRNCLREVATYETLDLQPGQTYLVERTMTFDSASWGAQHNIRALAWLEQPVATGSREVYQSRRISWPLPPLPPVYELGDLNCSGVVSFEDINPFVVAITDAAAYAAEYPDCDRQLADINQDGTVGFADINPFVALLTLDAAQAGDLLRQLLSGLVE